MQINCKDCKTKSSLLLSRNMHTILKTIENCEASLAPGTHSRHAIAQVECRKRTYLYTDLSEPHDCVLRISDDV